MAALLHDIGHYPFSHALEEAGFPSHETLGVAKLLQGELGERLTRIGGRRLSRRRWASSSRASRSPLQGLISGSIDLDKVDYLSRDARMCGVPYGTVDVDRLLSSLTLVEIEPGRYEIGVQEKGVSALESLLFAKYQMYRNVYWHHAVRSATCMFKRAVRAAVARGTVTVQAIADATDDGLMELLIERDHNALAAAIRARRLYKRAMDLPASDVPGDTQPWVADDPDLLERVEDVIAARGRPAAGGAAAGLSLRDPRCWESTCRSELGQAPSSGSPMRVAPDIWASPGGRRAVPERAPAPYLCGKFTRTAFGRVLEVLTWPAESVNRRLLEGSTLL